MWFIVDPFPLDNDVVWQDPPYITLSHLTSTFPLLHNIMQVRETCCSSEPRKTGFGTLQNDSPNSFGAA